MSFYDELRRRAPQRRRGPDVLVSAAATGDDAPRPRHDVGDLVTWFAQLETAPGQPFELAPWQADLLDGLRERDYPTLAEQMISARRAEKRERTIIAIACALLDGKKIAVAGANADELLRAGAQRAALLAAAAGIELPAAVADLLTMTPGNRKDRIP